MSDLISRETMKDAIDNTTWYHQNRNSVMVEGAHGVEDAWFKAEDVFKAIENAPTAQSNTPTDTPTDLISRQAAIDGIKAQECDSYERNMGLIIAMNVVEQLPSAQQETSILTVKCELDDEELSRAIEAVKNAELELIAVQPEQRWIPCSERLPEDSYGCIVSYHGFMMTPSGEKEYDAVYYETVGFDGQGWNNANGENIDNLIDVTAWMPLPEPYKEEQE